MRAQAQHPLPHQVLSLTERVAVAQVANNKNISTVESGLHVRPLSDSSRYVSHAMYKYVWIEAKLFLPPRSDGHEGTPTRSFVA